MPVVCDYKQKARRNKSEGFFRGGGGSQVEYFIPLLLIISEL